jgi:ABC-2 type transport system ATP-binding protein
MNKENVIQVDSLVKRYNDVTAVDGVSFAVNRGEVFSFVGPNGAGKTTTVEILVCLRDVTEGKATVLGFDVSTRKGKQQIRKRVGVCPQEFSTFDLLTVKENINYYKKMYDSGRDTDELIDLVNLKHKTKTLYKNLSGGLKKRVAIAITLVNDPDIIFLDEPTTGLDPKARRDVWDLIEGLRDQGKTVFLTTHYMDEAEVLSDRVVIISSGKIIADGTPSELILKHGGKTTLIVEEGGKDAYEALKDVFPKARVDNGDVLVPLKGKSDLPKAVMVLNDNKVNYAELIVRRPNLEDVFLNLTGKKIVDGELN